MVALVDVDGLKRVNDRDGHTAGDHVLRTLAATLRSNLRSFDPIVRYGGDEFVCGLGGVDPERVERRFGEIDQELQEAVGVGITVGLASLLPNDTLDKLISRAAAALLDGTRRRDEPLEAIRRRVRRVTSPADSDIADVAGRESMASQDGGGAGRGNAR